MPKTYQPRQKLLAQLWEVIFPTLEAADQERLLSLPEPCLNHIEDRLANDKRKPRLIEGCRRLLELDLDLLLTGFRLHPYELCRAAEATGPLPERVWIETCSALLGDHVWTAGQLLKSDILSDDLWLEIEALATQRELPQVFLDRLEDKQDFNPELWAQLLPSLKRFLVRAKLEKIRYSAYKATREIGSALAL